MSPEPSYQFQAQLWLWREDGSWHFVTLPEAISDEIEAASSASTGGFGSVRVEVSLGPTTWRTSLFPSKSAGSYVLPVKKAVRNAANAVVGDIVDVSLRLVQS